MQLVSWGRNAGQLAALADTNVAVILRVINTDPEYAMIRLLHRSLFPPAGTVANNLTVQLFVRDASTKGLRSSAASNAADLTNAALAIAQMPDGPRRMMRGVLLEATIETLLSRRSGAVRPEAIFDGVDPQRYANGQTDRGIDLAIDDAHLELFECKIRVLDLDQGDVDLLQDVAEAAAGDGRLCTPAIAGFYRNSLLSAVLASLAVRISIFSADLDDLASLPTSRATTRVAN